jgi:hypothetical protein
MKCSQKQESCNQCDACDVQRRWPIGSCEHTIPTCAVEPLSRLLLVQLLGIDPLPIQVSTLVSSPPSSFTYYAFHLSAKFSSPLSLSLFFFLISPQVSAWPNAGMARLLHVMPRPCHESSRSAIPVVTTASRQVGVQKRVRCMQGPLIWS